jgi:signal transduction histidine kinase
MSTSHIQWAGISTSQENKRRSLDNFAEQAGVGVDEQQPELLSSIQRAVEQERLRIAEDLHDTIAQDVALALHKLEHVQHLLEQSQLYQAFQEVTHITSILENGLDSLRSSIEPRQFDERTSFTSLMTLIQEYQQDHSELQLDCRVEPPELLTQFPSELEAPIFRFVQQALHNIWQHASATHVAISLVLTSNVLTIEVSDNGKGFSPQHQGDKPLPYSQFGLRIMRERIEHAHGIWKIESQPGGGTSVYAAFPLKGSA